DLHLQCRISPTLPKRDSTRRKLCPCPFENSGDIAHHRTDELLVVAFSHDADDGLSSRFTDEQTPARAKLKLTLLDRLGYVWLAKRRAVLEPHALEDLRDRLEQAADLACLLV